jgi:hypothetical protein
VTCRDEERYLGLDSLKLGHLGPDGVDSGYDTGHNASVRRQSTLGQSGWRPSITPTAELLESENASADVPAFEVTHQDAGRILKARHGIHETGDAPRP